MADLRDNQADNSAGFIKTSVLDELPYFGTIRYTCLTFLHVFFVETSNGENQILYLPCPMPLQSSLQDRVRCGGVEAISYSVQPEGGTGRCVTQVLIITLMATLV